MGELLAVGCWTAATGGRGSGVVLLARDPATGRLRGPVATDPCDSPSFLAAAGAPGVLHAAHELDDGVVSTRRPGGREVLGRAPTGGAAPCHVGVHPGGELLAVADYGGAVGIVDAPGGIARDLVQVLTAPGSGPRADRQESSHPHSATFLDAGTLLVADLGTDELRLHGVDPATRRVGPRPVQVVRTPPGCGPRHVAVTGAPGSRAVHVTGELDATVLSLPLLDAPGGARLGAPVAHPALAGAAQPPVHPGEVAVLAPGRLVVTNRGADVLTVHEVVGGTARPVHDVPLGARNPRHVRVLAGPGGRAHLYVSAQDSDAVVHLALDADLAVVDRSSAEVASPTCVLPLAE
ncbi:lactonase family protein [Paenibacillus sp. TRM 82003]|uniref:lactonase family protein n=1 Tax=Kineococcus sp. TRM81007 TaxID=2925831 RepID=UPI001F5AB33A|nr:beta-propeller fold lactonase family protein [Kineococcus sp. TRM81007]MCI2237516.1 lactonase family protein [Kineococcus sp. TRM81007]MCI3919870.1 lactonase family protein [Paenibacillus sp. TRM 82003]